MKKLRDNQTILFKIFTLMFLMSATLIAEVISQKQTVETVEVSLDSFGLFSIVFVITISSLIGVFFMKDEFSKLP